MKKILLVMILIMVLLIVLTLLGQESQGKKVDVIIKEIEPFTYCSITHKGSFTEIPDVIGELLLNMRQQNLLPMGPMIGIFQSNPAVPNSESSTWEVGFPVVEQTMLQAPLEKKQWVFKTVASATHIGPYENSGETISQILLWMETNGYVQAGPILEKYFDEDPSRASQGDLKTEISIPYLKKNE